MKQFIIWTISLAVSFTFTDGVAYCQDKCAAVIDWHYVKTIYIYDKPDGTVIHQMRNDTINEDFLQLVILEQTNNYYYVSIHSTVVKDSATGWIKKGDHVGAYKRHEKSPMDLILYKDPGISNIGKIEISEWLPVLLTIENYAGNWVLVSLKHNGQLYKGWIEAIELCANSYTYCN